MFIFGSGSENFNGTDPFCGLASGGLEVANSKRASRHSLNLKGIFLYFWNDRGFERDS